MSAIRPVGMKALRSSRRDCRRASKQKRPKPSTSPGRGCSRCPTEPGVRLAVGVRHRLAQRLDDFAPEAIHIATEGPLGFAARRYCTKRRLFFTTAYHTNFPEYFRARFGIPLPWGYAALRHFHARSSAVMVATETVRRELAAGGFERVVTWTRGVDAELFRPSRSPAVDLPRPVFLSVGRVAAEKNLPYFLDLELPGSKLVAVHRLCVSAI